MEKEIKNSSFLKSNKLYKFYLSIKIQQYTSEVSSFSILSNCPKYEYLIQKHINAALFTKDSFSIQMRLYIFDEYSFFDCLAEVFKYVICGLICQGVALKYLPIGIVKNYEGCRKINDDIGNIQSTGLNESNSLFIVCRNDTNKIIGMTGYITGELLDQQEIDFKCKTKLDEIRTEIAQKSEIYANKF